MENKLKEIAIQLEKLNKSFEQLLREFQTQKQKTLLGFEESVYNIGSTGESRISEK